MCLVNSGLTALPAHAGSEGVAVLPLEMINEAYKANNPGLLIADVRYHGGLYVELTQTNQHVEYVYVDTIGSENYTGFCGMAYDAPARQNTTGQLVIKPGTCGPVPGKLFASSQVSVWPLHLQCSLYVWD